MKKIKTESKALDSAIRLQRLQRRERFIHSFVVINGCVVPMATLLTQ